MQWHCRPVARVYEADCHNPEEITGPSGMSIDRCPQSSDIDCLQSAGLWAIFFSDLYMLQSAPKRTHAAAIKKTGFPVCMITYSDLFSGQIR